MQCLIGPSTGCVPSYPSGAPTFLDSQLSNLLPKSGYARSFTAGPAPTITSALISPTSTTSYAYLASPINQNQTGVRGFGGDASGVICFTPTGAAPGTASGALDMASCTMIQ
jgi:hypothetical protein